MTSRRIPTRSAPRGFTLIEMMLAIGVLALILDDAGELVQHDRA